MAPHCCETTKELLLLTTFNLIGNVRGIGNAMQMNSRSGVNKSRSDLESSFVCVSTAGGAHVYTSQTTGKAGNEESLRRFPHSAYSFDFAALDFYLFT